MLKWFISPEGEIIEVEKCLKEGLLHRYYPMAYLELCAKQRKWTGVPSTTQLINGTRMEYLKILVPYAINPKDQSFMIDGTMAHEKLEKLAPVGSFSEYSIPDDEISGIADLLEQQPNGEWWLTDYKRWGSFKVAKALGLKAQTRPLFDEAGCPVLYKRSGKGFSKGDQRTETYFIRDRDLVDMDDTIYQLNRYRIVTEKYFDIMIPKMKVFIIVRDGNTHVAKNRGVLENIYYIDVPFMEDSYVEDFFNRKRQLLIDCIESYKADYLETEEGYCFDSLKENAPPMCSDDECWSGRRCRDYCPVVEACRSLGNHYLEDWEGAKEYYTSWKDRE